jgi:hypothetical protein
MGLFRDLATITSHAQDGAWGKRGVAATANECGGGGRLMPGLIG